jgi:hypothetical protein
VNETNPSPSLSSSIYDNPDLEKSLQSLQVRIYTNQVSIYLVCEFASFLAIFLFTHPIVAAS